MHFEKQSLVVNTARSLISQTNEEGNDIPMATNEDIDQDREKWEADIISKMGITILPDIPKEFIHVATKEEWETVMRGAHDNDVPILVYFGSSWCEPCKYFSSILQELHPEFAKNLYFVHVDINEFPHLAHLFNIEGLPMTVIVYHNQVIERFAGVMPGDMLRSMILQALERIKKDSK